MPNIAIISVGKIREKYFSDGCLEYIKRLSPFCKLKVYEIDEEALSDNPSEKEIKSALSKEGVKILKLIPPKAFVIALCIEGEQQDSVAFSKLIDKAQLSGEGSITFIIGGSNGISGEVKRRSDFKLSFSEMTFPRQIARLLLLEQIYRGYSILNNGKYHK